MRASAALILRDMRILFTVASLLVVVVVLGLIAKTQVQSLPKADAGRTFTREEMNER